MGEIIINSLQIEQLLSCLEFIFKTKPVKIKNETRFTFNNEVGRGFISVFPINTELVQVHAHFTLNSELSLNIFNFKLDSLNFIYVTQGNFTYKIGSKTYQFSEKDNSNLILNTTVKSVESIILPAHTKIEFTFVKIFDLACLSALKGYSNLLMFTNKSKIDYVEGVERLENLEINFFSKPIVFYNNALSTLEQYENKGFFKDFIYKKRIDTILSTQLQSLKK